MHWFHTIMIWVNHFDRTDAIVAMTIGVVVGTYCMRGLARNCGKRFMATASRKNPFRSLGPHVSRRRRN